jgi:DNA polymerase III delta subunit
VRESLSALEKAIGSENLRVADALESDARLLRKLKRPSEAKPLEARAIAILRAQTGQQPRRYSVDTTELGLEAGRR